MSKRDWSARENRLIVGDYFTMLIDQQHGASYNKTEHNKRLRLYLDSRTRGSVERKHMNISAVMHRLGHPIIDGYKPLGNAQLSLATSIVEFLEEHPDIREALDRVSLAVPDSDELFEAISRETPPPERLDRTKLKQPKPIERMPLHIDYSERDHLNRRLGNLGEEAVYKREQLRLEREGRIDLAEQVEWASRERGDGLGFDIASFTRDGEPLFIEVKTTNYGYRMPFFISSNEVEFSKEQGRRYRLVRNYYFSNGPRRAHYVLAGSVDQHCRLDPIAYRAAMLA